MKKKKKMKKRIQQINDLTLIFTYTNCGFDKIALQQ